MNILNFPLKIIICLFLDIVGFFCPLFVQIFCLKKKKVWVSCKEKYGANIFLEKDLENRTTMV